MAAPKAAFDDVVDGVRIRVFNVKDGGYEAIAGDTDYEGGSQVGVATYSDAHSLDTVTALARQQLGPTVAFVPQGPAPEKQQTADAKAAEKAGAQQQG